MIKKRKRKFGNFSSFLVSVSIFSFRNQSRYDGTICVKSLILDI